MKKTSPPHNESAIYRLILETRQLFHVLAQASSELNREAGITASMRAVMETLYPNAELTVPAIARRKNVTRQHIQQIVNELLRLGQAETRENPSHKRSQLIALSPTGVEQFKQVLTREKKVLQLLAQEFDADQIATASETLGSLRVYFDSTAWQKALKSLPD